MFIQKVAKMLLAAPKVLIIESPFIGLDATTRKKLTELLADLARSGQVQIILSVSSPDDIPAFITHVYSLEKGVCGPKQTRDEFFAAEPFSTRRRKLAENYRNQPPRLPDGRTAPIPCEEMVRLRNITIRYGGRTNKKDVCNLKSHRFLLSLNLNPNHLLLFLYICHHKKDVCNLKSMYTGSLSMFSPFSIEAVSSLTSSSRSVFQP